MLKMLQNRKRKREREMKEAAPSPSLMMAVEFFSSLSAKM